MAKVDWTEPALKDLEIVINYIALDSPRYAERFGNKIVRAPRVLKNNAGLYIYFINLVRKKNDHIKNSVQIKNILSIIIFFSPIPSISNC